LLVECHAFFLSHSPTIAKHYSIQDQSKSALTDFLFRFTRRKTESTLLELLREQTVTRAIPRHQLHVVTATIEKDEQAVGQRIFLQYVLHNGHQPRERLPHVDWLAVSQEPFRRRRQEHRLSLEAQAHAIRERNIEGPTRRCCA